jgi:hypothetical protein
MNEAVIAWVPAPSAVVANDALALVTAAEPSTVAPSLNVAVPVIPAAGKVGSLTVARSTIRWPETVGLTLVVRVTPGLAALAGNARAAEPTTRATANATKRLRRCLMVMGMVRSPRCIG